MNDYEGSMSDDDIRAALLRAGNFEALAVMDAASGWHWQRVTDEDGNVVGYVEVRGAQCAAYGPAGDCRASFVTYYRAIDVLGGFAWQLVDGTGR